MNNASGYKLSPTLIIFPTRKMAERYSKERIDPFDSMETGNDRFMKAVKKIIAWATVFIGVSWLIWFWLIKP